VHTLAADHSVLSVFLDPVNVVIKVAPFPNGEVNAARFARELARAAWQWADELDPAGAPSGPPASASVEPGRPRHSLRGEFDAGSVYHERGV